MLVFIAKLLELTNKEAAFQSYRVLAGIRGRFCTQGCRPLGLGVVSGFALRLPLSSTVSQFRCVHLPLQGPSPVEDSERDEPEEIGPPQRLVEECQQTQARDLRPLADQPSADRTRHVRAAGSDRAGRPHPAALLRPPLPPLLELEGGGGSGVVGGGGQPGPHCFAPDGLDPLRPPVDAPKMAAVAHDDGWPASELSGAVGPKPEMAGAHSPAGFAGYEASYEVPVARRMDGKLDSFNEAFLRRRALGQGSGAASCVQTPTLRQMLTEKTHPPHYLHPRVSQGPHYRPQEAPNLHCGLAQARRMPAMQLGPQSAFLQHSAAATQQGEHPQHRQQRMLGEGEPPAQAAHSSPCRGHIRPSFHPAATAQFGRGAEQRAGGPAPGAEGKREHFGLGVATGQQYVYGGRPHYRLQEPPREAMGAPLYQHNSHGSPVQTPQPLGPASSSPQYVTPCPHQETENGGETSCIQLLNPSANKLLAPQLCPTDLYWEQVHQTPPSCGRLAGQRRGLEEKEEAPYPFSCGCCKEQFRNAASFQAHVAPGACMGTSHPVTQNNVQKVPRDGCHFSAHLPTNALAAKAPAGESCRRDSPLAEASGDFLSGQEMRMLSNMVDYSTPESAEGLVPKYPPVTVYRSYLRSVNSNAGDLLERAVEPLHYTPQPMLDPLRKGSGLFCNLHSATSNNDPAVSPYPCNQFNGFDCVSQDYTTPGNGQTPRINVGARFQAVVEDASRTLWEEVAVHGADLVWKPWKKLSESLEVQGQVEDLLNLACSSALPGGGLNREFALHCLSEVEGDVMVTLEKLLLNNGARSTSHPLADYHYSGSSNWSPSEKRLFNKAFALHKKDFRAVQKVVRTKDVAECVEYYYTFKKSLKFNKKLRPRASDADEDWNGIFRQDTDYELPFTSPQPAQRGERESPCPPSSATSPANSAERCFTKSRAGTPT
ncbi:uncharacterized protein LOC127586914 [Pristis pectinata]|uniref:uncharacterized protein LOC127586914 n=1 Tax=Pristis pectinata TaxID=685728 RepID=UPI00223D1ED4|nr:uncharacterized protein LOC127586914 [Pristis pectinata]